MSFLILLIASGFEVAGVSTLNVFSNTSHYRKKLFFLLLTLGLFTCSLGSLSIAMQEIPLSVAYAVWTGVGAVGAVLVGVIVNKDTINAQKVLGLAIIIVSAIALKIL